MCLISIFMPLSTFLKLAPLINLSNIKNENLMNTKKRGWGSWLRSANADRQTY